MKINTRNFLNNNTKTLKKIINIPNKLNVGDFITIGIKVQKKHKIRIQEYSGLIISKKNTNLNSTINILTMSKTIYIKHCFFLNLPNIVLLKIHYALKTKRSKLYYLNKK